MGACQVFLCAINNFKDEERGYFLFITKMTKHKRNTKKYFTNLYCVIEHFH